jgi:hypothetical protein
MYGVRYVQVTHNMDSDSACRPTTKNQIAHIAPQCQYWPGSRAERPILSSAPRGGGDGDPPCVLAYRRWGPIYIAVHTQRMELWVDFFEVLRLLIWWESQ